MLKQLKILSFLFVLLIFPSISGWCIIPLGPTALWWTIEGIMLILAIRLIPRHYAPKPIKWYLLWVIFAALHGVVTAKTYWDWKMLLDNILIYSIPLFSLTYYTPHRTAQLFSFWCKWAPFIVIILLPLGEFGHYYSRMVVPFTTLLLFLPLLKHRGKIMAIVGLVIVCTFGISSRADLGRSLVCLLIGIAMYPAILKRITSIIKPLSLLLILSPAILFILALTGTYNILKLGEDNNVEVQIKSSNTESQKDLFADDRTGLYIEALASAINYDYYIEGNSLAKGYESPKFGIDISNEIGTSDFFRGASEVAIINVFTYMGIIGVVLYFIVFAKAVQLAVWQSNNPYMKLVGLYIGFRWMCSWLEEFQKFDLNTIILWILIGMCYSPKFRNLNSKDFKHFARKLTP